MPIVTPQGTFFHLPKAGGTWISQVLTEQFGGVSRGAGGGHAPVCRFQWDEGWNSRGDKLHPTFGVVRDPWSWYASLYRFSLRGKRQGGLAYWGAALEKDWVKKTQFRALLYGMTHPWEVPEFEPGSLGIIFQPFEPQLAESQLRSGRQGFCSWLVSHMFATEATWGRPNPDWAVDFLFDQADLHAQLVRFFKRPIERTSKDASNRSGHIRTEFSSSDYQDWYDPEMRRWVEEADAWFIEWAGYEFGRPGSNLPFHRVDPP